jgi:hypothetical protein
MYESSLDYAQKPQRNCTFMNSASEASDSDQQQAHYNKKNINKPDTHTGRGEPAWPDSRPQLAGVEESCGVSPAAAGGLTIMLHADPPPPRTPALT